MSDDRKNREREIRNKLEEEIGPADWKVLRAHYNRGAVIIVSRELDLFDVAVSVATDNAVPVGSWIREGRLVKPTPEDARRWEETGSEVTALVVAPYILVQEGN